MARREQVEITTAIIKEAEKLVGVEEVEFADTHVPGLAIRVRPRGATWILRGRLGPKQTTWRIAPVKALSPKRARERAYEARAHLRRGADPRKWLKEEETGGKIERTFDPRVDGWSFEAARDHYLEHIKAGNRPATWDDYRKTLCSHHCSPLVGKLLKNIERNDIRRVRERVLEATSNKMAAKVTSAIKRLLNWAEDQSESGIEVSVGRDVKTGSRKEESTKELPKKHQVAALIYGLGDLRVDQSIRLACLSTLLTAQRRETIASARKADFEPDPKGRMGAIWRVHSTLMKRSATHSIPLPPWTWGIFREAIKLSPASNPWVFPQIRKRRAADAGDGHLSASEITHTFRDTRCGFTPHDVRTMIATYGERDLGFLRSDSQSILHHLEGDAADVTRQHYVLHDGVHFKWRIMRSWTSWVYLQMVEFAPDGLDYPTYLPTPKDVVEIST